MKAKIKAPDTITINRDADGVIHHQYWTADQHLGQFDNTEYIRKDALIEWANNWKRIGVSDDFAYAMDILIKHINAI